MERTMKDEYIIISKTAIQKRIEETIKYANEAYEEDVNDEVTQHSCSATIRTLERILSQSTPLIPILEQAYFEGECYGISTDACINKQDYIVNLKLDI